MKYELDIDDVTPIIVQDLTWLYDTGLEMRHKDLKAIERVLRMYMTEREFSDWQGRGSYA